MHHKRHRPKNRRAGCLLCKGHKANGAKRRERASVVRRTQDPVPRPHEATVDRGAAGC